MSATGSAWRPALLLVAAAAAAIVAVNTADLPLTAKGLSRLAGGEPVLDLRLGYGPEVAYGLLDRLGSVGRRSYLTMLWSVDLLLPALFGLALATALRAGAYARWRWLALAAAAADYLENAALSALIAAYPSRHAPLVLAAALATGLKFGLYALAAAVAVAGAWKGRRVGARRYRMEKGSKP